MKICTRCVLPATFPGISFNDKGICNFCVSSRASAESVIRDRIRGRFEEFASAVSQRDGLHCLIALSGGKDSAYTLVLLRKIYELSVIAVTFDNGYLSSLALENARRVSDALGVEHVVIRPDAELMRKVFAGVADGSVFPSVALERASSICNACMGMVKSCMLRMAIERLIPAIAYGWSPGQAPPRAAFFRMNPSMVRSMQRARVTPLIKIAGPEFESLLLNENHLQADAEYPYNINPLAFFPYDEGAILETITKLGWRPPGDTDGNSTNCRLNQFANRNHIHRHGFHPYSFEVAGLVRSGYLAREDGLAKLADLGDESLSRKIARELGLEDR